MSGKKATIILTTFLLTAGQFCSASSDGKVDNSMLQVYLPRDITVKDNTILMGQIAVIRGPQALTDRAGEIAMGQIAAGQEIVIDRQTLLSRLACNGIPASSVTLSGAEKITVKKQQRIIRGTEFIEQAKSFFEKNEPAGSVCQKTPVKVPADLVVPLEAKDVKLVCRLAQSNSTGQATVYVAVLVDGKEIDVRQVSFNLKYNCRAAAAAVDIPAGAVLGTDNIKIENAVSNSPEPADWKPPYGLIAKRRLAANTMIRADMTGSAKPATVVGRNQTVIIKIEKGGLLITAIGKTMQEACAGDYIKVRNADSQRIIVAKVNEDGTVEPVF
jgi:flagella basal body P-ring formation protein FlgA